MLYCAAEKTRATKRPWEMMILAYHFKRKWAFAAFRLICRVTSDLLPLSWVQVELQVGGMTGWKASCRGMATKNKGG